MFGISSGEILIILVLALILVKPEDLPAVVRKIGQVVATLQGYVRTMQQKSRALKDELANMAGPVESPDIVAVPPAEVPYMGLGAEAAVTETSVSASLTVVPDAASRPIAAGERARVASPAAEFAVPGDARVAR